MAGLNTILASFLIAVMLMSSLHTSFPDLYQQSQNTIPQPNTIPLAYADDDDDDEHDDENDDDELEDDAEDLAENYEDLIEELGRISGISDEAVVTDYLIDAITDLRDETKNLVSDKHARKDLIKILDHALKRADKSAKNVLKLKEDDANREIDKVRSFIQDYIDEVEELSEETTIPQSDADLLISKADKISSDSLKRGIDAADLISGVPLLITTQIIDRAKSDVDELRILANEFVSLGFTVDIEARTMSPTRGFVSFSNPDTSQEFEIEITPLALASATTVLIVEDAAAESIQTSAVAQAIPPSAEEFAALLVAMPLMLNSVLANPQIQVAVRSGLILLPLCVLTLSFALVCASVIIAGSLIAALILYLQEHPEVLQQFRQVVDRGAAVLQNAVNRFLPPPQLIIIKKLIKIFGGTATEDEFIMRVTNNGQHVGVFTGKSEEQGGVILTLQQGSYGVDEINLPSGYIKIDTPADDTCSGQISRGQTKVCTITNTDKPAKITLIKEVINDDGGNAGANDFGLSIDGIPVTSGIPVLVFSNIPHMIDEVGLDDYQFVSITGKDCPTALGATVTLDEGEEITCKITNDDVITIPISVFEENFDGQLTGWSQSLCSIFGGQECFPLQQRTDTQGGTPPSPPNWGVVEINDFVGGCAGAIQSRFAKSFVATADTYDVSATLGAKVCDTCIESAQIFIDGALILEQQGPRLSPSSPQPPSAFKQATVNLGAGVHTIEIGMHSNFACFSVFGAYFDDIKITPSTSGITSSATSMLGGPYFDINLQQTVVNTVRPGTVIAPLQINWDSGYEAEPVTVSVIGANGTGISHSVSSTYSSTSSQLFDIVFEIPSDVQTGEYQFLISVKEVESDDSVGVGMTLNVE